MTVQSRARALQSGEGSAFPRQLTSFAPAPSNRTTEPSPCNIHLYIALGLHPSLIFRFFAVLEEKSTSLPRKPTAVWTPSFCDCKPLIAPSKDAYEILGVLPPHGTRERGRSGPLGACGRRNHFVTPAFRFHRSQRPANALRDPHAGCIGNAIRDANAGCIGLMVVIAAAAIDKPVFHGLHQLYRFRDCDNYNNRNRIDQFLFERHSLYYRHALSELFNVAYRGRDAVINDHCQ